MFQPFRGKMAHAIDGDSIWVNRAGVGHVKVRLAGVDAPSAGADAELAKAFIDREWPAETVVHVKPTAQWLVHGEIPADVTRAGDRNLSKELLRFASRLR
jgi:endonuclease YncB( thermonuclease family)